MIDVIQIYKSQEIFSKSSYTPDNRKKFNNSDATIDSTNGYLDNNLLILPNEFRSFPDIKTADLIIVQDIEGWNPFLVKKQFDAMNLPEWFKKPRRNFLMEKNKSLFAFKQLSIPKSFEFFKISKTTNDVLDLYIDYTSNATEIGIPERNNHKICELKQSKPIRYKINGKSDFTLSGRKERTFFEYDFIIEWVGKANKIEFRELNKIKTTKTIPTDRSKMIDERKIVV